MKEKVIKNTAVYTFSGLVPFIVNFVMLPVYTRYMTPEDYGVLGLLNTLSALLLIFMGFQLANSLFRFYFDYDTAGVKRFFSTVVYTTIATNVVFVAVLHVFGDQVIQVLFPKADITYVPYILLVLITAFFASLSTCATLLLKVQEKARIVMVTALVHVALGLVLNVYFVVYKHMGAIGVLAAGAINSVFHAAFLLWMVRDYFVAAFDRAMLRVAFSFSLPLIANGVSGVLFIHTDKWVLGYTVPLAQIGLYNVAQRFASLLQVLVRSFKDSYTPSFMGDSVKDAVAAGKKYGRMVTKWSVGMSVLALGLALFSEEIIQIMTPAEYYPSYNFVPPLVAAYVFNGLYFFSSNVLLFKKHTGSISVITFIAGVFNLVANIVLIPVFGALTVAYTTLAAHALTFFFAFYVARKDYHLAFDWPALSQIFGAAVGMFLVIRVLEGDSMVVNILIKCAGMSVLTIFLLALNYAGTREDARLFVLRLRSGILKPLNKLNK